MTTDFDLARDLDDFAGDDCPTDQPDGSPPTLDDVDHVNRSDCREYRGSRHVRGYGRFHTFYKGKRRQVLLSRWIWEQFNGPIPPGGYVCHRCDNPPCFRLSHLFLGDAAANVADMVAKGRQGGGRPDETQARGTANPNAKLTDEGVRQIRDWSRQGVTQRAMASRLGVSQTVVGNVLAGRSWTHVR